MLAEGIHVALGADGAPCNNNLDGFVELRLAALLHKPRVGAAAHARAATALELATLGGARALGLEREIGSLEPGKRADLIVVDPRAPHATPAFDPVSTLVYAAQSRDVRDVLVDGRVLVRNGALTELTGLDRAEVVATAQAEAARVQARVRAYRRAYRRRRARSRPRRQPRHLGGVRLEQRLEAARRDSSAITSAKCARATPQRMAAAPSCTGITIVPRCITSVRTVRRRRTECRPARSGRVAVAPVGAAAVRRAPLSIPRGRLAPTTASALGTPVPRHRHRRRRGADRVAVGRAQHQTAPRRSRQRVQSRRWLR